ncbi:MAG: hypothetical protein ACQER9_00620 [Nanobdellota archaeon]
MTIDSHVGADIPCIDKDHVISRSKIERGLFMKPKEWERDRARELSRPLPGGSIVDDVKFYAKKDNLKLKYNLMMFALEEKYPVVYKALTSIIFPEPY